MTATITQQTDTTTYPDDAALMQASLNLAGAAYDFRAEQLRLEAVKSEILRGRRLQAAAGAT